MLKINEAFYHLQGKDMFVHKSHSHNEIELIEVVKGAGTVIKNDKTYELKSRYIYIIDARNVHIVYPQPEDCRDYIRNKIVIDADSFEEFCKNIGIIDLLENLFNGAPVSSEYTPEIDLLYKKICSLVNMEDAISKGFAHGYIIQLLNVVYSLSKEAQNYSKDTTIQKILSIVADKKGIISLEEISEELHMSKFYVSHMFKNKTGRNISHYISDKVYENAVKMLKENIYSIEEIAFQCGFSAAPAFTRFFKNKSGVSPTLFRKMNRKNTEELI
ncbi:MAG: helix-turn-helix transcriptional regulator [Clostridia bacterium]|nr:helix-turn-helix transcriptional regulator [Clostridia bacterium]